jgi:DNA-entry nuclease
VTPVYDGDDLVASGIQMEAWSVEDNGEGICFNIYAYNNQPGIEIDYATGDSELETDTAKATDDATKADTAEAADNATKTDDTKNVTDAKEESTGEYVVNTNTRKFHKTTCSSVSDILSSNRETIQGSRSELIEKGYEPCQRCQP